MFIEVFVAFGYVLSTVVKSCQPVVLYPEVRAVSRLTAAVLYRALEEPYREADLPSRMLGFAGQYVQLQQISTPSVFS